MRNFKGVLLLSAAWLARGGCIGPAAAQETEAGSQAATGEIVVTAQRRQERAQDMPVTVAVNSSGASIHEARRNRWRMVR
jgi:outer membrane receptor protein involved in Fe transport